VASPECFPLILLGFQKRFTHIENIIRRNAFVDEGCSGFLGSLTILRFHIEQDDLRGRISLLKQAAGFGGRNTIGDWDFSIGSLDFMKLANCEISEYISEISQFGHD
jgi:hypothetical protein